MTFCCMFLMPNWPISRVIDWTVRIRTFPQSTLMHFSVRCPGSCTKELGTGTDGGYARGRNGGSSSSVISCGASVRNDWKEAGRVLASVTFCKGGIGKPEGNVDVAGAFFASKCASSFLSEIGVPSGPRKVEFKAAPSFLGSASVPFCGVALGNALVVFSLLTAVHVRSPEPVSIYIFAVIDIWRLFPHHFTM